MIMLIISLCFVLFLQIISAIDLTKIINTINNPQSDWNSLSEEFQSGELSGYFTYNEGLTILESLNENFPQYITKYSEIGKTYENRPIYHIILTDLTINKNRLSDLQMIFITGLHHAREPMSFMMNIYLMIKILFQIHHNDNEIVNLLKYTGLIFVPAVNIDGYFKIEQLYNENKILSELIRKNRRNNLCTEYELGVDLNRNYGYKFGYDNDGSSNYKCAEDYRGEYPFSEPETQAIRDIIMFYKENIKLAINFHAYGNLWITPFNFLNDRNNLLLNENIRVSKFYKEFETEAKFSNSALIGNSPKVINYFANGEASDWLLGELGIISLSPELGNDNKQFSEVFYPPKNEIFNILENCFPPIEYLIKKVRFMPEIDFFYYNQDIYQPLLEKSKTFNEKIDDYTFFSVQFYNKGLSDEEIKIINIKYESKEEEVKFLNIREIFYNCFDDDAIKSEKIQNINGKFSSKMFFNSENLTSFQNFTHNKNNQEYKIFSNFRFKGRNYCFFHFGIKGEGYNFSLNLGFNNIYNHNMTISLKSKNVLPLYQHKNFLIWPAFRLLIFFIFLIVLCIIVIIWRRNKKIRETKLLLKQGHRISNEASHIVSNNDVFRITDEENK